MTFTSLRQRIQRAEEIFLTIILTVLICVACLQIALRVFFDHGIFWADPLLRYLTLWGGMLGAVLAVSQGKHICLDIINNLLNKQILKYLNVINALFSACICSFLFYAAYRFIVDEISYGVTTVLGVPSWLWNLIFPLGFAIMALRYFCGAILRIMEFRKTSASPKRKDP